MTQRFHAKFIRPVDFPESFETNHLFQGVFQTLTPFDLFCNLCEVICLLYKNEKNTFLIDNTWFPNQPFRGTEGQGQPPRAN